METAQHGVTTMFPSGGEAVRRLSYLGDEGYAALLHTINCWTVKALNSTAEDNFEENRPFITEGVPGAPMNDPPSILSRRRALLVGAGPSALTDQAIDGMKSARKNAVIVACGRIAAGYDTPQGRVRGLLEIGVPVDIIMDIDPIIGTEDKTTGRRPVLCPPRSEWGVDCDPVYWADIQVSPPTMRSYLGAGVNVQWFATWGDPKASAKVRASNAKRRFPREYCERAAFALADAWRANPSWTELRHLAALVYGAIRSDGTMLKYLPALNGHLSSTTAMFLKAAADGASEIGFLGFDMCEPRLSIAPSEWEKVYEDAFRMAVEKGFGERTAEDIAGKAVNDVVFAERWGDSRWWFPVMDAPEAQKEGAEYTPESFFIPEEKEPGTPWDSWRLGARWTGEKKFAPTRLDMILQREHLIRVMANYHDFRVNEGIAPVPCYVQCAPEGCLTYDQNGDPVDGFTTEESVESFVTRED